MRRSRSQLKNLSAYAAHGNPAVQNGQMGNAGYRHAEEIQRRINALGAAPQQHVNDGYYSGVAGYPVDHAAMYAPMPAQPFMQNPNPAQFHPPMYADFPSPGYQHQGSQELEALRASIEQMGGKLAQMEHMTAQAPLADTGRVAESVSQNMSAVAAQLNEMKQAISGIASNQPGKSDIDNFRKALDDAGRAFSDFSSRTGAVDIDPQAYAKVVEKSHESLAGEIEQMRQSLLGATGNPDIYAKTLEASHDDLKSQMANLQEVFSAGIGSTNEEVSALKEGYSGIHNELETIRSLLDDQRQAPTTDAQSEEISKIEMRLEEITRAIVAISHGGNVDQLERLEARIADLSRNVTAIGEGSNGHSDTGLEEIKNQLSNLSGQLVSTPQPQSDDASAEVSAKLDALTDKIENLQIVSNGVTGDADSGENLLAKLDELVDRVGPKSDAEELQRLSGEISTFGAMLSNASGGIPAQSGQPVDDSQLQSLENRLSEISEYLQRGPGDLSGLDQKLTSIEEQVSSSRDIAIEMANQAATDAVEKAVAHLQGQSGHTGEQVFDPSLLSDLANDVKTLHQNTNQNSSDTLQTFDALKDTLEHMVGRLASIEDSLRSGQVAAPQAAPQATSYAAEPNEVHEQANTKEIPDFDEPVPLQPTEHPAEQTRSAQFDALLNDPEPQKVEPKKASVAQSLVEEANRAEQERLRNRATNSPEQQPVVGAPGQNHEFNSDELAADRFEQAESLHEEYAPQLSANEFPVPQEPESGMAAPEPVVEETPLEPGTGGPDLAALVRQANERRKTLSKNGADSSGTDFIAAARRAAQAAAEEANAAQESAVAEDKPESKGLMRSLPDLFGKRKKAMMMAAGAALLAAIAIPIAGSLMGPGSPEETARIDSTITASPSAGDSLNADGSQTAQPVRVVEVPQAELETATELDAPTPVPEAASLGADSETPTQATSGLADQLEFGNEQLKTAVAQGDAGALFEVGRRYMEGHGTEKNLEQAKVWFERSANLGFAPAQYLVGNFNEKGIGSDRDTETAVKWYKKAAANGNIIAMHNLAVLHATPNGVSEQPDLPEAFNWFKQAAQYGVRDSQVNLGIFYTKGVGTDVDLVEAYKWFTLAAKAGDKDAENKRTVVGDALRPDQLQEAKTRIETWKPNEAVREANNVAANAAWTGDLASAPLPATKNVVAKTQTLLSKLGYDAGPADGIMGDKTRDAILQFQQRVGLSIDGQITAELLRELEAVAI